MSASPRAVVTVTTRPLWILGLGRTCLRVLLYLAAVAGIAVTVRDAIAPPRPAVFSAPRQQLPDAGAEAFSELFTRRYLTWDASNPGAYQQGLAPFAGPALPDGAGVTLAAGGTQQVQWAQVVQSREDGSGGHVYTVAAQTDSSGLLYLAVPVRRDAGGQLLLDGYPAFVGAPATGGFADRSATLPDVSDASLQQVVTRALRNYLDGGQTNLAADLTPDARVSLPALTLNVDRLTRLTWAPDGRSVNAELSALDTRGTTYTLGYQLDVRRAGGRWEISAIQMDPNT